MTKYIFNTIFRLFSPMALALLLPLAVSAETVNKVIKAPLSRSDWKEVINWPLSCDSGVKHITDFSNDFIGVERYLWFDGRNLVSVICETGAYNQGEMIFLESKKESGEYNLIYFPQFRLIEDSPHLRFNKVTKGFQYYQKSDSLLWGNLSINESESTITNNNFYRGGGGCGISTTYVITQSQPSIAQLKIEVQCQEDKKISEWTTYTEEQYNNWPISNIE
ncbi:hypothetical protein [Photobacterium kagoshimensis]|uniref:hypothetical protein n=1 Tax=Photobacterium kagoshimensis TaxID=2910242 RepID=UPI003D0E82D3